MMKDDLGQASLDFLAGVIIFMGSLIMIIQFIPGIFTPFQTEVTDLNSVAYRTGVLLLEDPGWWSNTSTNTSGTDWENHLNNTQRVGLASVDAANKTTPNVLNKKKVEKFANISKDNLTEFLGLYRNISGYQLEYGYNISLFYLDGGLLKINDTNITAGYPIPATQDIAKIERLVMVDTGEISVANGNLSGQPPANKKVQINYTHLQDRDFKIIITSFNITTPPGPPAELNWVQVVPGSGILKGSDGLVIKLNGTTMVSPTFNSDDNTPDIKFYNQNDEFELILSKNLFTIGQTYTIEIKFSRIDLNYGVMIFNNLPKLVFYDRGKLTIEVWQ